MLPRESDQPEEGERRAPFHPEESNRPGGAIRSGRYKLIRRYDDQSIELYDLSNDIGEQNNLAGEKPELAAELDGQLRRWLVETKAQLPDPRK